MGWLGRWWGHGPTWWSRTGILSAVFIGIILSWIGEVQYIERKHKHDDAVRRLEGKQ